MSGPQCEQSDFRLARALYSLTIQDIRTQDAEDFTGGETKFYVDNGMLRLEVKPERGMALVFVHRQLHEGAPVVQGRKYG